MFNLGGSARGTAITCPGLKPWEIDTIVDEDRNKAFGSVLRNDVLRNLEEKALAERREEARMLKEAMEAAEEEEAAKNYAKKGIRMCPLADAESLLWSVSLCLRIS